MPIIKSRCLRGQRRSVGTLRRWARRFTAEPARDAYDRHVQTIVAALLQEMEA